MGRKALYCCVSLLSISVGLVYVFAYVDLGHVQKTVKNAVSSISHMRIVFDPDDKKTDVQTDGSLIYEKGNVSTTNGESSRPSILLSTLSMAITPDSASSADSSLSTKTPLTTSIMDFFGIIESTSSESVSSKADDVLDGVSESQSTEVPTSATTVGPAAAGSHQKTILGFVQRVKASQDNYHHNLQPKKRLASKSEIENIIEKNVNLFTWPPGFDGPQCVGAFLKMLPSPEPLICTFNLYEDKIISKSLQENGTWENDVFTEFKLLMIKFKDLNLIDLGANLGVYSLAAARLGRHVIAVEPCYRAVNNLHRSVVANQYESKIKLFVNAIAEEKGLYRMIHRPGFIHNATIEKVPSDEIFLEDLKSMKIVPSITLNELIPYADFKKAILKIDISGSERDVFKNADEFFTHFDIPYIFMHWENVQHLVDASEVVSYLVRKHYRPKHSLLGDILSINDYTTWTGNVIWIKSSVINISFV